MDKTLNGWYARAIRETKGNQTQLGCLVIALGVEEPKNPPRFSTRGATILSNGQFIVTGQTRAGNTGLISLGPVENVVSSLRHLADRLKLTDVERIELFDELRKFASHDHRPEDQRGKF